MQTLTFNKNDPAYFAHLNSAYSSKFSYNSQDNMSINNSDPNISNSNNAISVKSPFEKLVYDLNHNAEYVKQITLGKVIGFYRVGSEIGSGNFSQVKLGVHLLTREKVAIKILDKTKLDDKTQRLLLREISSMEKLHHPNVIRLYEVIHKPTKLYICMEYAPEGELYTKINEFGKLNENECKYVYSQIISAVDHMHSHNIIHRDIKAENIFYYNSSPPFVKLGDFGFSIEAHIDRQLNTYCGSPPYAAPELFRDDSYIGIYVDIWALGVLLYFMITGLMPFKSDTVSKLKRIILNGDFVVPSHVSDSCQLLIRGILRLVPADRFSIQEIMDSAWLDGEKYTSQLEPYQLNPCVDTRESKREELRSKELLETLGITEDILIYCNLNENQIEEYSNGFVNITQASKNLNLSPIPIVSPVRSSYFSRLNSSRHITPELKQFINGTYRIIFHCVQKEFRREYHRISQSYDNLSDDDSNPNFYNGKTLINYKNHHNHSLYDNSDNDEEYDNEKVEAPYKTENKSIFVKLNTETNNLNQRKNNMTIKLNEKPSIINNINKYNTYNKIDSTNGITSNNNKINHNNNDNNNKNIIASPTTGNNSNNSKQTYNENNKKTRKMNANTLNKQIQTLYKINRKLSNVNNQMNTIFNERNGTFNKSSREDGHQNGLNKMYNSQTPKAFEKQSSKLCTIL